jgi:hypothetical protein
MMCGVSIATPNAHKAPLLPQIDDGRRRASLQRGLFEPGKRGAAGN